MPLPARLIDRLRQSISRTAAKGALFNVASAFLFYWATVFVHEDADVRPEIFALVRYAMGALFFSGIYFHAWRSHRSRRSSATPLERVRPSKRDRVLFIFMRALFNVVAVVCFYKSVALGNTGTANVLNMTYPAFVALFAGPMIGEAPSRRTALLALAALLGTFLNSWGSFTAGGAGFPAIAWGVASGVTAALAVVSLRGAAKFATTSEILFWMFLLGTVLLVPAYGSDLVKVPRHAVAAILASALCGVVGQWMLTVSYKYVDATAGSVLSSARIPIAVTAGFLLLAEPFSVLAWVGAGVVFASNVLLAFGGNKDKTVPDSSNGAIQAH